jgi:hypothetical protein
MVFSPRSAPPLIQLSTPVRAATVPPLPAPPLSHRCPHWWERARSSCPTLHLVGWYASTTVRTATDPAEHLCPCRHCPIAVRTSIVPSVSPLWESVRSSCPTLHLVSWYASPTVRTATDPAEHLCPYRHCPIAVRTATIPSVSPLVGESKEQLSHTVFGWLVRIHHCPHRH